MVVGFRNYVLGLSSVAAVVAGSVAIASPTWAGQETSQAKPGCRLVANKPVVGGSTLKGAGSRGGCSDTVTYFWVRVYKVIDLWPDQEKAATGKQYVQNGNLTAVGACDGRGEHYTHVSTATGTSGDSVESGRVVLC
jgi:hypothetical protein